MRAGKCSLSFQRGREKGNRAINPAPSPPPPTLRPRSRATQPLVHAAYPRNCCLAPVLLTSFVQVSFASKLSVAAEGTVDFFVFLSLIPELGLRNCDEHLWEVVLAFPMEHLTGRPCFVTFYRFTTTCIR